MAPWGNPTNARRFGDLPAGVWAHAVAAGLIASRSGRAMLAPMPCKIVRREICFFDIYMSVLLFTRTCRYGWRPAHPELIAPHNALDQRGKLIILTRRLTHNPANGRHIVILQGTAIRVHQEAL